MLKEIDDRLKLLETHAREVDRALQQMLDALNGTAAHIYETLTAHVLMPNAHTKAELLKLRNAVDEEIKRRGGE